MITNGLQHTVACIFLKIKHLNPVYQQKNGFIEHTTNLIYLVKNIVMSQCILNKNKKQL